MRPPKRLTAPNPFTYTGRFHDLETGNYYYRARYYQPNLGRFLQRDPLGFRQGRNRSEFRPKRHYEDGNNLYEYVSSNPKIHFDPTGDGIYDLRRDIWDKWRDLRDWWDHPDEWDWPNALTCPMLILDITKIIADLNRYGRPGAVVNDKFAHCYFSCRLWQECGENAAKGLGLAKELVDWLNNSATDSAADEAANQFGRNCGRRTLGKPCPVRNKGWCAACCSGSYGNPGGQWLP